MKKQKWIYEVYAPMPYCEVYLVPAISKKEARLKFESSCGSGKFECVGEVSCRRKTVRRIRKATGAE